jgi:hypothetical protein
MKVKNMKYARVIAVVVSAALIALGVFVFLGHTARTESAIAVLQKSGAARSQVLAALGPNTDYHTTATRHKEQPVLGADVPFALPEDTVAETHITFDDMGRVNTYSVVIRGTDGRVYQHTDMVGGRLVVTDIATGQTDVLADWGNVNANGVRASLSQATTDAIAATGPSAKAGSATVNGRDAFVVETTNRTNRTYYDKIDYHLLKSEQIAPDGRVTEYLLPTLEEILDYTTGPTATGSATASGTATPTAGAARAFAPVAGLGIAVGAPSLSGGKVLVPVNSTGTGVPAYSGLNIHVRWDGGVFSFDSVNSTGGVIASPLCAAFADDDGGGARYACISGGQTTATGLLATIVLSPAASGCSSLHLFTLGAPDNGDQLTASFILSPTGETLEPAQYVDGSANVGGQVC